MLQVGIDGILSFFDLIYSVTMLIFRLFTAVKGSVLYVETYSTSRKSNHILFVCRLSIFGRLYVYLMLSFNFMLLTKKAF